MCFLSPKTTKKKVHLHKTVWFTLTRQPSHLCIYRPTFLHHGVEARRHGLVLPVRCARRAGRPGTAVVGRVRHGSRERASYWGGLRGAEEFVRQSVCGDWRREGGKLWLKPDSHFTFITFSTKCQDFKRNSMCSPLSHKSWNKTWESHYRDKLTSQHHWSNSFIYLAACTVRVTELMINDGLKLAVEAHLLPLQQNDGDEGAGGLQV